MFWSVLELLFWNELLQLLFCILGWKWLVQTWKCGLRRFFVDFPVKEDFYWFYFFFFDSFVRERGYGWFCNFSSFVLSLVNGIYLFMRKSDVYSGLYRCLLLQEPPSQYDTARVWFGVGSNGQACSVSFYDRGMFLLNEYVLSFIIW